MAIKNTFSHPALDLSHQSYAILALGDKPYTHFCRFGQALDQHLKQHQAKAVFEMVCVDHLKQADLKRWTQGLEQLTQQQFTPVEQAQNWRAFMLKNRVCLNTGSQGKPIYHIQLSYAESTPRSSGDILEVQCGNLLEDIQAFLQVQQQIVNQDLLAALQFKNLSQIPEQLPNESFNDWIQRFDLLAIREYSIARIRSQPAFYLKPTQEPLILIGNGTGIAGLVAHLSQRQQWNEPQNWLIFAERQQQFDHLYKEQIQLWQAQRFLPEVDYAFSRDQSEKIYVQHILQQKSAQLLSGVEAGAAIYVCGSLKGMAQEVEQTLLSVLGAEQLVGLKP
ncbi:hypothetical protein E0H80_07685 [Acinetobacter sp. ANC 4779]|uniref:NADPH cytochrome P450 oxidoreductase family protein n=1 Tax=Acinetobacter sp. ANC 4779 TaxID=2529848 RepID=UPI00103B9459|nr:NADPH cytochrome P450 oxidoreductase family protein [Acinetobacter sp. ANC 4779]TCB50700.1 hypothetical protein E0H80_07685 [Acinetobacter sp. ANC 4779]